MPASRLVVVLFVDLANRCNHIARNVLRGACGKLEYLLIFITHQAQIGVEGSRQHRSILSPHVLGCLALPNHFLCMPCAELVVHEYRPTHTLLAM